jgi:hypothetical protein
MQYECDKCHWSGTWDALVLETLCPLCRSSVSPRQDKKGVASRNSGDTPAGTVPGPPPRS